MTDRIKYCSLTSRPKKAKNLEANKRFNGLVELEDFNGRKTLEENSKIENMINNNN